MTIRWLSVFLPALLVGLASAPAPAETIVLGPEQRTTVGLTLYAQENLALVRDVRHATLPAGELVVRYTGVPEQLDPRTVSLHAEQGGPVLRVHEQTFRYDLASPEQLLARWLGKSVELVETDEQLATKITNADLLALGNPPVYRVGDRLLLGHPGRVQLPPLAGESYLTPTLEWTVTSAREGACELAASYAAAGFGWEADYTLTLASTDSPTTARLTGWVTMRNDTDGGFERATVALVAGRIHRVARPAAKRMRAMHAEAVVADAAVPSPEPRLGQHRYALADPVDLDAHQVKQVPLLAADGVRVARTFRVTGPGLHPHGPAGEDEQSLPVEIRLRTRNERGHGLGKPLPAGIVRVEAPTSAKTVEFVGEDHIGHLAEGEALDLLVGEATDVVAKRRQIDYRQTGTKPWEAEATVVLTLRNATDAEVAVEVREPIPGAWKVLESNLEAERVNAATLGFAATVPAKGSLDIRYRVQLGQ